MKKKIVFILVILILLLTGCNNKDSKFYLDDKYYNTDGSFIEIEKDDLEKIIKNKESFIIFTHLPYCTFSVPCDVVFQTFLNENKMSFYSMPYDELSEIEFFKDIKYAPSVIIINKGKIVAYLDANSDSDIKMYQDSSAFKEWIGNYIYLKN